MADFQMHLWMVDEVASQISRPTQKEILWIAAQGPDPFLYQRSGKTSVLGSVMHDTDTGTLLRRLVELTKTSLTEETYSFLVGFLCHYVLDIHLHPYVYYHVGIYRPNRPETHHLRGLHMRFERSIDCAWIPLRFSVPSRKYRVTHRYYPAYELPRDVSRLIGDVSKEVYHIEGGDQGYRDSVDFMRTVLRHMVPDRFGFKKMVYRILDLFARSQDLYFRDLSYYHHVTKVDFLNLEHRTWLHPMTGTPSKASVLELYEEAKVDALRILQEVDLYLFEDKPIDFEKLFPNLSFNTGVDCLLGDELKYIQPYE